VEAQDQGMLLSAVPNGFDAAQSRGYAFDQSAVVLHQARFSSGSGVVFDITRER
jgi:hypothetical protein